MEEEEKQKNPVRKISNSFNVLLQKERIYLRVENRDNFEERPSTIVIYPFYSILIRVGNLYYYLGYKITTKVVIMFKN